MQSLWLFDPKLVRVQINAIRCSFKGFPLYHYASCIMLSHYSTILSQEFKENTSTFLHHFNFAMDRKAGKKTKETAPPANTRLETTAVVHRLLRQSQRNCPVVNILIT